MVEGEHFITPRVEAELFSRKTKTITDLSVSSGRLNVRLPKKEYLDRAKLEANSTGDITVLSETDLEVIALAMELNAEGREALVVSDDYSLQNLCNLLKINFKPMMTKGITQEFWWFLYCPACGATYEHSSKITICSVCGHQLKRKVYSKKTISNSERDKDR